MPQGSVAGPNDSCRHGAWGAGLPQVVTAVDMEPGVRVCLRCALALRMQPLCCSSELTIFAGMAVELSTSIPVPLGDAGSGAPDKVEHEDGRPELSEPAIR